MSNLNRRTWIQHTAGSLAALSTAAYTKAAAAKEDAPFGSKIGKYGRFQIGEAVAYGVVEGDRVRQLKGDLFGTREVTDKSYPLKEVKWLVPVEPKQVFALAGNYKSHLGEKIDPMYEIPQLFLKSLACLLPTGENIVIPPGAENVHYEAEMVVVIGREARNVPQDQANDYVLGVTCGNDVSARDWQKQDRQWWRAKCCETFGPVGPFIVTGINYDDLLLTLKLNGEIKQQQRTCDLIHNVAAMVSFMSRYQTLYPGDLIFTGTPGKTSAIKPGDTVEVELEKVGTLMNGVMSA
jgi:2-keto-4-pentenoate hydratase/2-oxohepta-3-ene-1,7-dioic acid hydratase in catechol pathway